MARADLARVDRSARDLIVDPSTRGIANAVVTLDVPGYAFSIPEDPLEMVAVDCRFEPHVLVVPAGGAYTFLQEGGTYNVHTYSTKDPASSRTVPADESRIHRPRRPEVIPVADDLHPWMNMLVSLRWLVRAQLCVVRLNPARSIL